LPIDVRIDSAKQAAKIIHAAHQLEAKHGILITVPVPEDDSLSNEIAEKAIQQATEEAEEQGIHGKEITPFVLGRVVELTEGQSMKANQALLVNNARVAAGIAKAL
jgi:pseudouridylate synthase